MDKVALAGPFWTDALLQVVLGAGAPADREAGAVMCRGQAAKRALFFAHVAGLTVDPAGGITASTDTDPGLLCAAAPEIMGYFGRVAASDLKPRRQMILSRAAARLNAANAPAPATLRSTMPLEKVEICNVTAPHEGYFLTRSYTLRQPQFDGTKTHPIAREVFVATDAALVLPYDPVRDRVLLVEQFRMGPLGRGDPLPWVLEPVAGRVDGGETPEETARRECLEEADLPLNTLEHVSTHYCSPGCSTEVFHCYVGLCELPDAGQSLGGLDTEHEDLRRHVISFDHAMDLTRTGEINIGPLFALLLWLERERPRLRASA